MDLKHELPACRLEHGLNNFNSKTVLNAKITQSEASKNFAMCNPIYANFGKDWLSLGAATILENNAFNSGNINLLQTPKRVTIMCI